MLHLLELHQWDCQGPCQCADNEPPPLAFGRSAIEDCYLRCPDSFTILVETLQMYRDYESTSDIENPFLLACDILHIICLHENSKFCESIMRSHQYSRDVARCRKIKDTTMYLSLTNENRANVLSSAIKKKNAVVENDEENGIINTIA